MRPEPSSSAAEGRGTFQTPAKPSTLENPKVAAVVVIITMTRYGKCAMSSGSPEDSKENHGPPSR